jgi:RNA polymerase sigma-70 factor, ECF subfamily
MHNTPIDHDPASGRRTLAEIWNDDRGHLIALATRMLGDRTEAEDAVQEAFGRLALVELDEIDDVRGWLAVVVRRLCLDRIRSAYARRERVAGTEQFEHAKDGSARWESTSLDDPADRITLDDQIQLALAVVLDRLTPAERTSLVLHDVFGFSFSDIAEIVGRTPAACRQLASRGRRSVRQGGPLAHRHPPGVSDDFVQQRELTERFIAACSGGDLAALIELLDADVDGEGILCGQGVFVRVQGRPTVAHRVLAILAQPNDRVLLPFTVEGEPAIIAFDGRHLSAVIRFDVENGLIRHIHTYVVRT